MAMGRFLSSHQTLTSPPNAHLSYPLAEIKTTHAQNQSGPMKQHIIISWRINIKEKRTKKER
jgi:hypothetical protein